MHGGFHVGMVRQWVGSGAHEESSGSAVTDRNHSRLRRLVTHSAT